MEVMHKLAPNCINKFALLLSIVASICYPFKVLAECDIPSEWYTKLESGPFIVSTYHTTGIVGSTRVIELQWPKELKTPISGVPPGRTDGAERSMGFENLSYRGLPKFDIFLSGAVDGYPLYSHLGLYARYSKTREILDSGLGFTYRRMDGLTLHPTENIGAWRSYSFESVSPRDEDIATWFRGHPTIEGVEAILICTRWKPEEFGHCRIVKKIEPVI